MNINFTEIGYFTTPFTDIAGMPIQPSGAREVQGTITIHDQFAAGLTDLDGFSHIIVIYHLHQIKGYDLMVKPFLDTEKHGVFATRSPKRPNPIGLSVMELIRTEGNLLHVANCDVLDKTPVLDIKPYVPDFDSWNVKRMGWFAGKSANATHHRSDTRFA